MASRAEHPSNTAPVTRDPPRPPAPREFYCAALSIWQARVGFKESRHPRDSEGDRCARGAVEVLRAAHGIQGLGTPARAVPGSDDEAHRRGQDGEDQAAGAVDTCIIPYDSSKAEIERVVTISSTRSSSWSRCGTCRLLFLLENQFLNRAKRTLFVSFSVDANMEGLRSLLRRQKDGTGNTNS